jgi:hypothetical protein
MVYGRKDARRNSMHSYRAGFICPHHQHFRSRYEWNERELHGAEHHGPQAYDQETKDDDDDAEAANAEEAADDATQYVITASNDRVFGPRALRNFGTHPVVRAQLAPRRQSRRGRWEGGAIRACRKCWSEVQLLSPRLRSPLAPWSEIVP